MGKNLKKIHTHVYMCNFAAYLKHYKSTILELKFKIIFKKKKYK